MKLCFIGNSHLAAIRHAWEDVSHADPTLKADFFGARGSRFRHLAVEGRTLVPDDSILRAQMKQISGGLKAIKVADYDAFVLVGLGAGLWDLLVVATDHRTLATVGAAKDPQLVSDPVFDLALTRAFEMSAAYHVVRSIRRVSLAKPICLLPTPLPCPGYVDNEREVAADGKLLCERMEPTWRASIDGLRSAFKATVIEQPAETIADRFFTDARFGQGSIRLRRTSEQTHGDAEYRHMNSEFGRLMMTPTLQALSEIAARTAAGAARAPVD